MACLAEVLLISITWGGTALAHPVSYSASETITRIPIPAPGALGPTCRVAVAADCLFTARFIERPCLGLVSMPVADIVVVTVDGAGTTVTRTFRNMAGLSQGIVMQDRSPALFEMSFGVADSMATDIAGFQVS